MSATQQSPVNVRELLRTYLRAQEAGATLDYVTITQETGIDMSARSGGRPILFEALRAEKIIYKTIRDTAVRLSSAQNARDFAFDDVLRQGRMSERAQKRATRMLKKHADDMSEDDKRAIIAVGAFHGTVALAVTSTLGAKPLPSNTKPPAPALPSFLKVYK